MFPPPFSREPLVSDEMNPLARAYRDVVVYDGTDPDDVLYEGPIVVHANGWLELEGGRLLSPSAVHHIDVYDGTAETGERDDRTGGDDGRDGDGGRRTGRFTPR